MKLLASLHIVDGLDDPVFMWRIDFSESRCTLCLHDLSDFFSYILIAGGLGSGFNVGFRMRWSMR